MSRAGSVKVDPSGQYYFIVDISPPGAERRQIRRRGYKTKKAAQLALDELKDEVRRGDWVEPSTQSVAEYLAEWLETIKASRQPSTWESYGRSIRVHVVPRIGKVPLQSLDARTLNKMYADLLASGHRNRGHERKRHPERVYDLIEDWRAQGWTYLAIADELLVRFPDLRITKNAVAGIVRRGRPVGEPEEHRGLAPKSVRNVHIILRRALHDAVKWGALNRNPTDYAEPPRAADSRPPEMITWNADQLSGFLEFVAGTRYYAPFVFMATTGVRRGEALGIRWKDIDFDGARVSLRQTVTVVDHRIRIAPRTKTGRGRPIDLDGETIAVLRAHRKKQLEERLKVGSAYAETDLVFALPDGHSYHPERFSREFERKQDQYNRAHAGASIPSIRLHDLRHTWATLALAAGVPTKIVAERLGHSTITITSDLYSHVTPTMQAEAAEKVAGLIFRASTPTRL